MDKVYEIYIKETLRWFENNINELDICYKKIRKINEKITDKEVKGLSERIALDIAGIFREYSEKLNELREIHIVEKSIIESLRERVQLLEIENARLKEENKFKSKEIRENNVLRELVNIINNNIKSIAASYNMKNNDRTGSKSNRFISELDTKELVNDYIRNNHTITKEMKEYYKEKYNITYNGLMERLKKNNVWQGRK